MVKTKISKAAQSITDANKLIERLKQQIASLERENLGLKKSLSERTRELEQLKTATKRSVKKVVRGLKVKTMSGQIKEIKPISFDVGYRAGQEKARIQEQVALKKMDRKERNKYYQFNTYIPQFLARLHELYYDTWDYSWDAELTRALQALTFREITNLMKMLGLEEVFYDSDSKYTPQDVEVPETARELVEEILETVKARHEDFTTTLILGE